MNDALRLCGDEDDLRVSWLGRFTHVLPLGLAIARCVFVVVLFCGLFTVLLCVAVLFLVLVCFLFLYLFLVCRFYCQITAFLLVGSRNYSFWCFAAACGLNQFDSCFSCIRASLKSVSLHMECQHPSRSSQPEK